MDARSCLHIDAHTLARILGGEVGKGKKGSPAVRAPGPGHSPKDRSLTVLLGSEFPDGFYVESFSPGTSWQQCKDYVAAKIGRPTWSPAAAPTETGEDIIRRMSAKVLSSLDFNEAPRQANGANGDREHSPRGESKPFRDVHLVAAGYRHVATYDYAADGKLLYQVLRYEHDFEDKKFLARRPDGKGWVFGAGDRRVLYR